MTSDQITTPPNAYQPNVPFFKDPDVAKDIGEIQGRLGSLEQRVNREHETFLKDISGLKEFRGRAYGVAVVLTALTTGGILLYFCTKVF